VEDFAASSPAGWLRIAEPDRLFRAAYALCGSREGAEELVLETFARARGRRRFVRRGGDAVHLMRELHRSWTGRERGRSIRPATAGPGEPIGWVVDRSGDPHVLALDVQRAYQAIAELPRQQREAIAAVDVFGLAHRDAARALRIRRRTLTTRLYGARERVAAALQETP
jgi:RNA polymerase sigma-70 factor, ECF subfamily